MARNSTSTATQQRAAATGIVGIEEVLLRCPVRGPLGAKALAKDGLTPTEEARRVDFLRFLVEERSYPAESIRVEVVTVRNIGEKGRNSLRADVIVYDKPWSVIAGMPETDQLSHIVLVAEIKRDTTKKKSAITHQLEPALRILPRVDAIGVYWDDENRNVLTKRISGKGSAQQVEIQPAPIASLPDYGVAYHAKAITVDQLTKPSNLVGTLHNLADVMRSHGINDEHERYKETVKLLLARYVDEKNAKASSGRQLKLQILEGEDTGFMTRVAAMYTKAAMRYSKVQTLFHPKTEPELDEPTLRDLVRSVQSYDLSSASSETMQQVFMTFVPAVFKKTLSQYFTPVSLIDTMVKMVDPGPTDKIADPAMGTADFLAAAMNYCRVRGDDDAHDRVYGIDSDDKAFDLAVINMILNHDGQAHLINADSIEDYSRWGDEMDVVLCNPPFGAGTLERRVSVLGHYDLGHVWHQDADTGAWSMTDEIAESQQLGILFIERCWKMLTDGGRLAIILPEGYLSTASHGYVRSWILKHFVVRSLVELPRRIFLKSGADLRSNILIATRRQTGSKLRPYPIHASMVRKVGYKLGGDFQELALRDKITGIPIRDDQNKVVLDSDFSRVIKEFAAMPSSLSAKWRGATVQDILSRRDLDMKPRRLVPRALDNIRSLKERGAVALGEIADVLETTTDLIATYGPSAVRRIVEGQDIRAIEGIVVPHAPERCWSIADRKQTRVYELVENDIIVGLVRPERRNVGILLDSGADVVGSPDGLAVVRVKNDLRDEYPVEWLFSVIRSEQVRLQFWTEAGGTSYGKLDNEMIRSALIPPGTKQDRREVAAKVREWIDSVKTNSNAWSNIGIDGDRRPILNSPLTGLFDEDEDLMADSETPIEPEDDADARTAKNRLAEIASNKSQLVEGEALEAELKELLN